MSTRSASHSSAKSSTTTTSSMVNVAEMNKQKDDERIKQLTQQLLTQNAVDRKTSHANRLFKRYLNETNKRPNLNKGPEEVFSPILNNYRAPFSQEITDIDHRKGSISKTSSILSAEKENINDDRNTPKSTRSKRFSSSESLIVSSRKIVDQDEGSRRGRRAQETAEKENMNAEDNRKAAKSARSKKYSSPESPIVSSRKIIDDDDETERERRTQETVGEVNDEGEKVLNKLVGNPKRLSSNHIQPSSPTKPTRIKLNRIELSDDDTEQINEPTRPKPVHVPLTLDQELDNILQQSGPKTPQTSRQAFADLKNKITSTANKPKTPHHQEVASTPKPTSFKKGSRRSNLSQLASSPSHFDSENLEEPVAGSDDIFNSAKSEMPPPPPPPQSDKTPFVRVQRLDTSSSAQIKSVNQKSQSSITVTKRSDAKAAAWAKRIEPVEEEDEEEDELIASQNYFFKRKSQHPSATVTLSSTTNSTQNSTSQPTSASALFRSAKVGAISIHADKSIKTPAIRNMKKSNRKSDDDEETISSKVESKKSGAEEKSARKSPRLKAETGTSRQKIISSFFDKSTKKTSAPSLTKQVYDELDEQDIDKETPISTKSKKSSSKQVTKTKESDKKMNKTKEVLNKKDKSLDEIEIDRDESDHRFEAPDPIFDSESNISEPKSKVGKNKETKSVQNKNTPKNKMDTTKVVTNKKDKSLDEIEMDRDESDHRFEAPDPIFDNEPEPAYISEPKSKRDKNKETKSAQNKNMSRNRIIEDEDEVEVRKEQKAPKPAEKKTSLLRIRQTKAIDEEDESQEEASPAKKTQEKPLQPIEEEENVRERSVDVKKPKKRDEKKKNEEDKTAEKKPGRKRKNMTEKVPEVRPVEDEPAMDDEVYQGLRRSKRHRVDKNSIPQYTFETITDYAGNKVRVKKLVGTREKPELFGHFAHHQAALKSKKQPKKPTQTKHKPDPMHILDDFVNDQVHVDSEPEYDRPKTSKSTRTREDEARKGNSFESNTSESDAAISLDMGDEKLDSLLNMSDINKSSEEIYVRNEDANTTDTSTVCNFYIYWKNIAKKNFVDVSTGVYVSPINDQEGLMKINSGSVSKTARHAKDLTLVVQEGSILVSINGTRSLHNARDIIKIPANLYYKLKNVSDDKQAVLYFWFKAN